MKKILTILLIAAMLLSLFACDGNKKPTEEPTMNETGAPTEKPTDKVTVPPTDAPTIAPTEKPTVESTEEPTAEPTKEPTQAPTEESTAAPTQEPTVAPTEQPTTAHTQEPTVAPTEQPTTAHTQEPTVAPTEEPTTAPTQEPTVAPTEEPTTVPTEKPTTASTEDPTEPVTVDPTEEPTIIPTEKPTSKPTEKPTVAPTEKPTEKPTVAPTEKPTEAPTEKETEMQTEAVYDDLASVGVYDKYTLDTYMSPIWSGQVVHNETVMFVGIDDQASLLYDADRIISVRSYDLSIEYVQGVDYDYVDGKLVLLEGTRIPYVPLETYYSVLDPNYPYLSTMYQGQVTQTMFGDGDTMTKWQVAVTYKHSDTWEGKEIESYEDRFASFIKKLENGEDVTVFFYGDSITTGATSSQSRAPYAPSYPRMFVQYVAKQYGYTVKYVDTYSNTNLANGKPSGGQAYPDTVFGDNGTITYINTAVGGWSTKNGVDNIREYVVNYLKAYGCDLFVLAFGMNNGGSTAADVTQYMRQIVQGVTRNASEANVVLVSTMIPNPEAVRNPADKYFCNGNQYTFEEAMYPLADTLNNNMKGGCAVAPMTSVSRYIHSQKRYRDTTGNNVNHPSDFLARTYAQVIYQTVFGYENYPSWPIDIGDVPVVDANYNAEITVGGNKLYLDGKEGTTNANFASCVRLEACNGGYFMYHIGDSVKEYINLNTNGEIEYSDSANTVWTYNATIKAMVSDGFEIAVALVKPEICLHPLIKNSESHYREACVRCGVEAESATPHTFTEKVTAEPDGAKCYELTCSGCGYVKSAYRVPVGMNMYYPISQIGLYNATDVGVVSEDGLSYRRVRFTSEGHLFINKTNSTSPIDGDSGNYLVMKYRTSGDGHVRLDVRTSDKESLSVIKKVSNVATNWEVAVVDLSQFANYSCDSECDVQIRITTKVSQIDIAYVAIVDSIDEAKTLITDACYVLYTDWSAAGEVFETNPTPDEPEIPTEEPTVAPTEKPSESESESEETPKNNVNVSVGVHNEFNLDSYMTPIWDGNVVHNETVLFVGADDTPALLYDPDRIISVRSYDLSIEYIEGVDFEIVDGKIVRLEGSRIPFIPLETYYSVHNDMPYLSTMVNGVVTQTMFGEGSTICKWQIAITYKHSDTWEGIDLKSYTDRYAALIDKLEKGEDVTLHFYGDSITAGGNASSSVGISPYTPIWAKMFTQYVAKQYGYTIKYVSNTNVNSFTTDTTYGTKGTITYINTAVGGWNTQQGRDNFDEKVKAYAEKYGCDLFILAFGMNNGSSTADFVCGVLDEIVVKLEACAPDADVLLVSTMLPNPEAVKNPADKFFCNGNQPTFEEKMIPLAEAINNRGTNCALAPMTSMTRYLYTIKRFRDTTGNNVNHPSDFVVRLYAQTLFETVFGYENYDNGGIELDNKPVENANFNAELTTNGNALYLDGASGTTNKDYAVCVRFEKCDGGYYMYHVEDSVKVYINVDNGALVYSNTAMSVWTYDESLDSIVSGECALKLSAPAICIHPTVISDDSHGCEACIRCGFEAIVRSHTMLDSTTVNADGSTTYETSCSVCGKVGRTYTIPANVIYYSGSSANNFYQFFMLNKEVRFEDGVEFTRVSASAAYAGHEVHWINQNDSYHYDSAGKPLDTKGNRYLVLRLRAGSDQLKMSFIYKLLGAGSKTISIPIIKEDEWYTYVIDLKSVSPDVYKELEDGTYTMQTFKIQFASGMDQIENGYLDIAYMALCDRFDQINVIAGASSVQLMATAGALTEVKSDGTCIGEHAYKETANGNVYTVACSVCGYIVNSKTLPEGINHYASAYTINSNANGASLINYAEVINDADGTYCRVYGGDAHATQNYNQFSLYSNSSASKVTGQYLVIKYRVGENGLGQKKITIYAGTENAGATNNGELIELLVGDKTTVEDGEWHIAVINMDTATGIGRTDDMFKAGEDGLFRAKFVSLRPFFTGKAGGDESDYMDIAFAAICDSVEEAEALIGSGSYDYYTTSTSPTVVNITE